MEFFKNNYRADQKRVEWKFMRIEKKLKLIIKEKDRLVEQYADGKVPQDQFVNRNVALDQDLLKTKIKREKLLKTIPSLHRKDDVEISIRRFCDNAKARLDKCSDFESKRKFLLDHIEKVIYNKYKVTLLGWIPIMSQNNDSGAKISFKIEDEINPKKIRSRVRQRFLVDSRLKEWGAGGRDTKIFQEKIKELQLPRVKATQVTQQLLNTPLREVIGYTVNGRKELEVLRNNARKTFFNSID
jgi:hypothetical protein